MVVAAAVAGRLSICNTQAACDMVLVVGRWLYALVHGVSQKFARHGVTAGAGATVWGTDAVEGTLLGTGGQRCGKAAMLCPC